MKAEHLTAMSQGLVDHVLDRRKAIAAQALAVNHQHATMPLAARMAQKLTQHPLRRLQCQIVQVELIAHAEFAALEFLPRRRRQIRMPIRQQIGGADGVVVQAETKSAQGVSLVLIAHPHGRTRLGTAGFRPRRVPHGTNTVANRFAEQVLIVVIHTSIIGHPPMSATERIGYHGAMRILLSNDDGVDAPGIAELARELGAAGHDITVVAPDRDRSGASNSLTLDAPIRVVEQPPERRVAGYPTYKVYGTPTDCVHIATTGLLEQAPDMVVSGINTAANLGDDVIYSGTVAAAMEGRNLGLPAIAMSMVSKEHSPQHYASGARAAAILVDRLAADPLPADTILNVNVPDVPWHELRGFEVTRLGNRHRSEDCVAQTDPRGRQWFWIGLAGAEQDAGIGTDFHCVRSRAISVTPLQIDLTRYQALEQVSTWVGGLNGAATAKEPAV